MKGAIAAFISATKRFVDENPNFPGSIGFIITGDEEGVAINGTKKVVEYLRKKKEKINFCIVGEPTNPNKLGEIDTKVTTKEATPLGEIDTKVSENAKIELPNIHGEVGARPTVELPNVYGTASTNNSLGNETVNDVVANSTTPSPLSNVNN